MKKFKEIILNIVDFLIMVLSLLGIFIFAVIGMLFIFLIEVIVLGFYFGAIGGVIYLLFKLVQISLEVT